MAADDINIDNGEDTSGTKEKKSRFAFLGKIPKKWLIIGLSSVLLLIVSAVVIFFFFFSEPAEEEDLTLEEAELGIQITPQFPGIFPLSQLVVPLADGDVKLNLTTTLELSFIPEAGWDEILDKSTQVQDAVSKILSSKTMREIRNINGKILLKDELIFTINDILETAKVRDIYFTEFLVR